ncbi:MAG: TetR/AcrR family transcriptional regulator [Clostridia bacterium]
MKDKIILASIKLLENFSVKFTVDDIKNELKISKKTIYKYFESKDELAHAVFNYIIDNCITAQNNILESKQKPLDKMVLCFLEYMQILKLQSDKIVEMYVQNEQILAEIKEKSDTNWQWLMATYHHFVKQNELKKIDDDILKIIVEAILKSIYFANNKAEVGLACIKEVIKK